LIDDSVSEFVLQTNV